MRVKWAQTGEGGDTPPFIIFTITYKVAVYAPSERADTLPLFRLYPYVTCGRYSKKGGRAPPPSPGWAYFNIVMECTPGSGICHSVCTLCLCWSRIHERTISLRFKGKVLRVCRLEVSVYNVSLPTSFQTTFAQKGGGVKSVCTGDCE